MEDPGIQGWVHQALFIFIEQQSELKYLQGRSHGCVGLAALHGAGIPGAYHLSRITTSLKSSLSSVGPGHHFPLTPE